MTSSVIYRRRFFPARVAGFFGAGFFAGRFLGFAGALPRLIASGRAWLGW